MDSIHSIDSCRCCVLYLNGIPFLFFHFFQLSLLLVDCLEFALHLGNLFLFSLATSAVMHKLAFLLAFSFLPIAVRAFVTPTCTRWTHPARIFQSTATPGASTSDDSNGNGETNAEKFPVLKQIQGFDWVGNCRYVGSDLRPASFLLQGGLRYDLDDDSVKLTSFLTFPNGKARQVIMQGERGSLERSSMRLDPTAEEGPIYMILTEVAPDTVLINEVDKASGKIIMTSSLSVVDGGKELVQISHELGESETPVEGHQLWRLKKAKWGSDDESKTDTTSFRDATGR